MKAFVLKYGRTLIAVFLFVVLPMYQTVISRIGPLIFFYVLLFSILPHLFYPDPSRPNLKTRLSLIVFPRGFKGQLVRYLIVALVAWAILSLAWSLSPERGSKDVIILLLSASGALILGSAMAPLDTQKLLNILLIGLVSSSCLLIFTLENTYLLQEYISFRVERFDSNRSAVLLVFLVFGVWASKRKTLKGAAAVLATSIFVGVAVFFSESEAAKLSLLAGICAGLLIYALPSLKRWIYVSLAFVFLSMPILPNHIDQAVSLFPTLTPKQAHTSHRIEIWKGYSDLIYQKPLFGWGLKSDRVLGNSEMLGSRLEELNLPKNTNSPHNVALEVWVTLGGVGAFLFAALIAMSGMFIGRENRRLSAASGGAGVAVYVVAMSGSSFYQSWFIVSIAVCASLFLSLAANSMHFTAHKAEIKTK